MVMHLAATHVDRSLTSLDFFETNVTGTFHLWKQRMPIGMLAKNLRHFAFITSVQTALQSPMTRP